MDAFLVAWDDDDVVPVGEQNDFDYHEDPHLPPHPLVNTPGSFTQVDLEYSCLPMNIAPNQWEAPLNVPEVNPRN